MFVWFFVLLVIECDLFRDHGIYNCFIAASNFTEFCIWAESKTSIKWNVSGK